MKRFNSENQSELVGRCEEGAEDEEEDGEFSGYLMKV